MPQVFSKNTFFFLVAVYFVFQETMELKTTFDFYFYLFPFRFQNNLSLLVRTEAEWSGMDDAVLRRNANVGFLAYSPLAGG